MKKLLILNLLILCCTSVVEAAPSCDLAVSETKIETKDFSASGGHNRRVLENKAIYKCETQDYECSLFGVYDRGDGITRDYTVIYRGTKNTPRSKGEVKKERCNKIIKCREIYIESGTASDIDFSRLSELENNYRCDSFIF